jgi:hypothetical protein
MNGFSVSTAGDVNGDGLDDLIIGSHRVDLNGKSEVGKSWYRCLRQQQKFHHYWCLQRYRHFHYLNGQ